MADDSTGSDIGGVGSQTDDYAKQIADINTRINGLVKNATLPTGPEKEVYDGLVRQRASLSAKAKDLADKTSRAGAKAPDLDEAVDKATPKENPFAKYATPDSGNPFAKYAPTAASTADDSDNAAAPEAPLGPTTKDTAAVVQPEDKDPELGITFGGSKVTSSEVPAGPTWEEAQKTLIDLDKAGVPPSDPRYKQAIKDKALGLQRLTSNGQDIGLGAGLAGGALKAAEGATKLAKPLVSTFGRAFSKAPEEAERAATGAAEGLRTKALSETEQASTRAAAAAQTQAVQAEAERAVSQGKLDAATKALDDDVSASRKKIEALTQQRAPAAGATTAKPFQTPQFVRGKPIEGEVPPRERLAAPKQRLPGLSGELDQAITSAQQKVKDHASRLYEMGTKTAGDAPIPNAGLREKAADFIDSLPPDMQTSVPKLITEIANGDTESMTVAELQKLRTTLRDLGDNPKLTPSLKSAPYAQLADKADKLLHSPANPPAVKQGVRIIDAADKFYAKNMKQFRSSTLQKIADDVRDGLPMDASKVLSTAAQSGESGTLQRIVKIGGDRARVQLRNADFENLMADAKKPGSDQIDGKKFLKAVEDRQRDKSLGILYGKEADDLVNLARKAAARDGAVDIKDVQPGKFKVALRRAEELKAKQPALAKGAEKAADKATPEGLADVKRDLEGFGAQLKDTSIGPDGVAAKTDTVVDSLYKKGLIDEGKYKDYLKQVKEVKDLYAKSKQAAADQRQARSRLAKIVGAGLLAAGGYPLYREMRNIVGF